MDYKEKLFFKSGDVVRIKQNIQAPDMVVKYINKIHDQSKETSNKLIGVTCFWFSKDNVYHSQLFSTKDLEYSKK
jgi:uncharacterized protein YodC (DUF2158 family)